MDLNQIIPLAIPIVTGGLAGGLVSWRVALHLNRKQFAIKIAEDYLTRFTEFDEVRHLLNHPATLANEENLKRVLALGNWFELASALYIFKIANRNLLRKLGMDKEIKVFRNCVEQAGGEPVTLMKEGWPHIVNFPKRPPRRQKWQ